MASLSEIASLLDVSSVLLFLVTLVVFSLPVLIIFPPIPVEHADALGQTHTKIGAPAPAAAPSRSRSPPPPKPADPDHDHDRGPPATPPPPRTVIHPLASCRGIELPPGTEPPPGLHDGVFHLARRRAASSDYDALAPASSSFRDLEVDLWLPDATKRSRQLGPMPADAAFLVVRFPWRRPTTTTTTTTTGASLSWLRAAVAAKLSRGSLRAGPVREFMLPLAAPSARERVARGYVRCGEEARVGGALPLPLPPPPLLDMTPELPPELAPFLGVPPGALALLRLDPEGGRGGGGGAHGGI